MMWQRSDELNGCNASHKMGFLQTVIISDIEIINYTVGSDGSRIIAKIEVDDRSKPKTGKNLSKIENWVILVMNWKCNKRGWL